MSSQNGQLILETLQNLEEPLSIIEISEKIADTIGVQINDVKKLVKETVDGGVRYGFIQRANKKYFTAPLEVHEIMEDAEILENGEIAKKMEDRSARSRRRRSRRGRRRVGSRRRRRY